MEGTHMWSVHSHMGSAHMSRGHLYVEHVKCEICEIPM